MIAEFAHTDHGAEFPFVDQGEDKSVIERFLKKAAMSCRDDNSLIWRITSGRARLRRRQVRGVMPVGACEPRENS
jgi:hypothetical protein